jgi:predicted Rossmann fold nucleotide-binding protein DprA/Smf involved in DNA uptake
MAQLILATIPLASSDAPDLIDILVAAQQAGIAVDLPDTTQLARAFAQADRVLEQLAQEILDTGGCWISEYSPGTRATKASFVARDRLQSGLAAGVLVVEAGIRSGTMHTARFALQQGRLLGCLAHPPGYSDAPSAAGNQLLIAEGAAMPIRSSDDLAAFLDRLFGDAATVGAE